MHNRCFIVADSPGLFRVPLLLLILHDSTLQYLLCVSYKVLGIKRVIYLGQKLKPLIMSSCAGGQKLQLEVIKAHRTKVRCSESPRCESLHAAVPHHGERVVALSAGVIRLGHLVGARGTSTAAAVHQGRVVVRVKFWTSPGFRVANMKTRRLVVHFLWSHGVVRGALEVASRTRRTSLRRAPPTHHAEEVTRREGVGEVRLELSLCAHLWGFSPPKRR